MTQATRVPGLAVQPSTRHLLCQDMGDHLGQSVGARGHQQPLRKRPAETGFHSRLSEHATATPVNPDLKVKKIKRNQNITWVAQTQGQAAGSTAQDPAGEFMIFSVAHLRGEDLQQRRRPRVRVLKESPATWLVSHRLGPPGQRVWLPRPFLTPPSSS